MSPSFALRRIRNRKLLETLNDTTMHNHSKYLQTDLSQVNFATKADTASGNTFPEYKVEKFKNDVIHMGWLLHRTKIVTR